MGQPMLTLETLISNWRAQDKKYPKILHKRYKDAVLCYTNSLRGMNRRAPSYRAQSYCVTTFNYFEVGKKNRRFQQLNLPDGE